MGNLKYIVSDVVTGKYLGVITIGSDVMTIKCRDEYIGWDKKSKIEKKRLNNIELFYDCSSSTIWIQYVVGKTTIPLWF